jgi:hypothetical protein
MELMYAISCHGRVSFIDKRKWTNVYAQLTKHADQDMVLMV